MRLDSERNQTDDTQKLHMECQGLNIVGKFAGVEKAIEKMIITQLPESIQSTADILYPKMTILLNVQETEAKRQMVLPS